MSDRTVHYRTCPLCEAMCGLEIHVEGDAVPLIRADRDDVWSKGFLCPKGTTLGHLHHDPDRLREPMIRTGDTWRPVGWDEAFTDYWVVMGAKPQASQGSLLDDADRVGVRDGAVARVSSEAGAVGVRDGAVAG